jgi:hypothetical protein
VVYKKIKRENHDPQKPVRSVGYWCQHSHSRATKGLGIRAWRSRSTACPSRASVTRLKSVDGLWHVKITNASHNHELNTANLVGSSIYRKWARLQDEEAVDLAVERLSKVARMTARQIAIYLSGAIDDLDVDKIDYSIRQTLNAEDPLQIPSVRALKLPITEREVLNIQSRLRKAKYGLHFHKDLYRPSGAV